ncbi:hypothetical protein B9Z55_000475 [Caenorhabditis nigoni]|uniref:Uncharacterized protein n=1 Tax=Caenorhabditis nigoni TaxID=1611254 RepID=A0A2G5VTC1_9PELO|nr:hypothetical protein B9Z55_000475 [Caenorhabditis nigoni]
MSNLKSPKIAKNEDKTENELRSKLFRKCLLRYISYERRCRKMEAYLELRRYSRYRTVPIFYLSEQLAHCNSKELKDWFKTFRMKEDSLSREEFFHFHYIIFYPDDIAEDFMSAWKWIKRRSAGIKKIVCRSWKRMLQNPKNNGILIDGDVYFDCR